ncbi:MAG: NADH-quinone oxidoreductase subunit N [Deltaproteobacteria bacterium]|nr:NADH-quinone oxidoreductase subunit N [Deltaproteobacteria bacterium]
MALLQNLRLFLPESILSATVLVLFIADFFTTKQKKAPLFFGLSLIGLLAALGAAYVSRSMPAASLFTGMVAFDAAGTFFKVLFSLSAIVIIFFSSGSREMERVDIPSYCILLLTLTLGMMLLATSTNLLMLYLSLEMVSISSYILSGFLKGIRRSSEAALKYVIYGGVASGIMAYGFSLLYGLSGTLSMSEMFVYFSTHATDKSVLFVGLVLSLAGFGYKIAAFPFHMWAPDVYEGAPTPVAAFFSVGPKAAGFAALIRFFLTALAIKSPDQFGDLKLAGWPELITLLAIVTMTFGNFAALYQTNLKRLLAYSSIAHAGYLLMGFAALNQEAIQAVFFYLIVYFVMNLGAFLVVIMILNQRGVEDLEGYNGIGRRGGQGAYLAVMMAVFLFSLTGLPPFAGFAGKLYLFTAVIKAKMFGLAIVGVLNSVVSLYYYIRVVKVMFFVDPPDQNPFRFSGLSHPVLVSGLAALTLAMGLFWDPLVRIVRESAVMLF